MRQLFYLSTMLVVIGANAILDGRGVAARQAKPAHVVQPMRLCVSMPFGSPARRSLSQGIANSVILATEQWKTRFRAAHLPLFPPLMLDDAGTTGGNVFDAKREEQNARTCAHRNDAFGYVGPLNTPSTLVSQPILNRAAMVQLSPASTGIFLTSRLGRARQQPATYQHQLAYLTFYRLITTDAMQGPSDAAYLKERLHAGTYFAVDDGITYSAGLIGIMQAYAARIGLQLIGSAHIDATSPARVASTSEAIADLIAAKHPDGVLYAADSYDGLLPRLLRQKGYAGPLVSGDTILDDTFIKGAGVGAVNVFSSRAGPDLPAVGRSFQRAYAHRVHAALQAFDALAYAGASVALNAMYTAAAQGKLHGSLFQVREAILPYVANARWHGATGVTSFDRNGDNRNRIVSMYAIRQGKWIYAGKAPGATGVSPSG